MFENLVDWNLAEVLLRLFLALVCGGILGVERGRKKRPAGLRTYMLVCVGAALVMMTNEYICELYQSSDPARMGAQVISGIGFLGAGTIIVTGHNRVKGLTTAAGLWAAACLGLSIGIGFYSGAIVGTVTIFFAMAALHNIDERVMSSGKLLNVYIELNKMSDFTTVLKYSKENKMKVSEVEFDHGGTYSDASTAILCSIHLDKKQSHEKVMLQLNGLEGVRYVEEL